MATVRIPTPLRKLTQGEPKRSRAAGKNGRRAHRRAREEVPRHQGAHLRRQRRGAPLRQHLRQGRGHPLPAEPRDAGRGQRTRSRSSRRSRAALARRRRRFDDEESRRYARQIVLPEVGGAGQERSARRARVAATASRSRGALPRGRGRRHAASSTARDADRTSLRGSNAARARPRPATPVDQRSGSTCAPMAATRSPPRLGLPAIVVRGDAETAVDVVSFRKHGPCPHALDARVPPCRSEARQRRAARWPTRRCACPGRDARRAPRAAPARAADGGDAARRPAMRRALRLRRLGRPTSSREPAPIVRTPLISAPGVIRRARLRVAERIIDLIGDTPLIRLQSFDGRARRRDLGQVRVLQPGRLGQGSRGAADDPRRDRVGRLDARQDPHRLDQRQHRRRLLDGRRGARLSRWRW